MEVWKTIADSYQISNLGRVMSFKRGSAKILKTVRNKNGYLAVYLFIDGVRKLHTVHRLVAKAFIPNPDNKPQVNHINGVKTDNRADNLEWCTQSENTQHAYLTGLEAQGENHGCAKLTIEQVRYIRNNPDKLHLKQLGDIFSVDQSTISLIQRGKKWKQAGGNIRKSNPHPLKISPEQRNEIRRLYIKGSSEFGSYGLAKKYGVNPTTILNIVHEN